MSTVVSRARAEFEEMSGRQVETVSGASQESESWRVSFEVVELERIPASTSLLGTYEVLVDDEGGLIEYGRVRRYYRNRADEEL
jgi:hypothetical protein